MSGVPTLLLNHPNQSSDRATLTASGISGLQQQGTIDGRPSTSHGVQLAHHSGYFSLHSHSPSSSDLYRTRSASPFVRPGTAQSAQSFQSQPESFQVSGGGFGMGTTAMGAATLSVPGGSIFAHPTTFHAMHQQHQQQQRAVSQGALSASHLPAMSHQSLQLAPGQVMHHHLQQLQSSQGMDGNVAAANGSMNGSNRLPHCSEPANYGIQDECNTSLWDLKDGPDGPHGKPPYPYLLLIRIALLNSEHGKLTLQELYDTLEQRYPYFKGESKGWKNSIRHNLSLNKCFKKEARHVLDPGKGSYWFVDLNEEHCTPRVRNRRKATDSNSLRADSPAKKRKYDDFESGSMGGDASGDVSSMTGPSGLAGSASGSGSESERERDNSQARDVRLPPLGRGMPVPSSASSSPVLQVNTLSVPSNKRQRATSAPSPITPSFFGVPHVAAGHPQPLPHGAMGAGTEEGSVFADPAMQQTYTFPPVHHPQQQTMSHHNTMRGPQYAGAGSSFGMSGAAASTSSSHSNTVSNGDVSPPHDARTFQSDGQQPLSVTVPPFGMPALVQDTTSLPSTAGSANSIDGPETPRTIFSHMLQKSIRANGNGMQPGQQGPVVVKVEDNPVSVDTPGPANGYTFPSLVSASAAAHSANGIQNLVPHQPGSAMHQYLIQAQQQQQNGQQGGRILVPPPQAGAGPNQSQQQVTGLPGGPAYSVSSHGSAAFTANRPSPLTTLQAKENRPHWSPPPSAAIATSPTRLLNSSDYDKLFSSAPFGMFLSDSVPRKVSRSGSIFGWNNTAATASAASGGNGNSGPNSRFPQQA